MVSAIILDLDGTLVDTNYLHTEAWARAFDDLGLVVPRASIHRQIGKGSDMFLPEFVQDEAIAREANRRHGDWYEQLAPWGRPLPGARELLGSLVERGYQLWLATSAKPGDIQRFLDLLGASNRLAGVVSSGDVEQSKPAPDLFAAALERSGVPADSAVALGDTPWDVQAAARANLRTVCVLTGGAWTRDELLHAGAMAVYQDCAELLADHFPEGL